MFVNRAQATVLMSGGIDSAACAQFMKEQGLTTNAVFLNYGQAAAEIEARSALALAEFLNIELMRFSVAGQDSFSAGELIGRNAFLIFSALFLTSGQCSLLSLGLHDGTPYYDCSEAFVASISEMVSSHTDGRTSVIAPFVTWTKQDIYDYFVSENLPLHLTYSCEAGTEPTCGICASCCDRRALGC